MTIMNKQSSIFLNGVLFDADIFWWKGFTILRPQDIDKTDKEIPEFIKLGRKRLLHDSAFRDFQAIDTRARTQIELYSYPFMLSGIRFVPFQVLSQLLEDLEALKKYFYAALELFIANFQSEKEIFLNKYEGYRDRLVSHYPVIGDLRYRYSFTWSMYEMAIPRDIKTTIIDANIADQLRVSWQNNQNDIQSKLGKWVDDIGFLIRKELIDICNNIQTAIVDGKIVRISTIDKTRTTIQRLKQMNFLDDREVANALSSVERALPSELDKEVPVVMNKFAQTLQTVSKTLTDSDISKSTGEFKRRFILKMGT